MTTTKKTLLLSTLLLATALIASTTSPNLTPCDKKASAIEMKLEKAREMRNNPKIDGLVIALSRVQSHCSNTKVIEDLEDKIDSKRDDLREHLEDYKKSVRNDEMDKIRKYENKVNEDYKEILELRKELKEIT